MSQRTFSRNGYQVLTGWDRPAQYFFLAVETDEQAAGETDDYVFSNLDLDDPGMSLPEVMSKLEELGIEPPPTLAHDLALDRRNHVGNLRVNYDAG